MFWEIVFSLLVLAHVVGDFVWQSSEMARCKGDSKKQMFYHGSIHGLLSLGLTILYLNYKLAIVIITLVVFHCFVDYVKVKCCKGAIGLITDQVVHISAIFIACLFLTNIDVNKFGYAVVHFY